MGDQVDIVAVLEYYRQQLSDKILELAIANAKIQALTNESNNAKESTEE